MHWRRPSTRVPRWPFILSKKGVWVFVYVSVFFPFLSSLPPSPLHLTPQALLLYCPLAPVSCLITRPVEANPHYIDNYSCHPNLYLYFAVGMICGSQLLTRGITQFGTIARVLSVLYHACGKQAILDFVSAGICSIRTRVQTTKMLYSWKDQPRGKRCVTASFSDLPNVVPSR